MDSIVPLVESFLSPLSSAVAFFGVELDHPVHVLAEILLAISLLYLLMVKSSKIPKVEAPLSKEEEDEIINQWVPETLVPPHTHISYEKWTEDPPTLLSSALPVVTDVDEKRYINLSSAGVLGNQYHPSVIAEAIKCTSIYGVGSCGPRGFYGSLQPHLDLEQHWAKFMNIADSVLFSSDFQTPASIIPAFLKPGDHLVVDEGISFAIQTGVNLSRGNVHKFRHNDMKDLRVKLESLEKVFKQEKQRVFLIVEGLYANTGDIVDLPAIMKLKETFHFRLFLDESYSLGTLGKTGRGITEYYNMDPNEVEVISASIGNAVGSMGGIAGGSVFVCDHMRLNCTGYVFSCSSPPYTAAAAITCLDLIDEGKELKMLRANVKLAHKLKRSLVKYFTTSSFDESAYITLQLNSSFSKNDRLEDQRLLEGIVRAARGIKSEPGVDFAPSVSAVPETPSRRSTRIAKKTPAKKAKKITTTITTTTTSSSASRSGEKVDGVLLSMPRFCEQEYNEIPPMIKLCIAAQLTEAQLVAAFETIKSAASVVLKA